MTGYCVKVSLRIPVAGARDWSIQYGQLIDRLRETTFPDVPPFSVREDGLFYFIPINAYDPWMLLHCLLGELDTPNTGKEPDAFVAAMDDFFLSLQVLFDKIQIVAVFSTSVYSVSIPKGSSTFVSDDIAVMQERLSLKQDRGLLINEGLLQLAALREPYWNTEGFDGLLHRFKAIPDVQAGQVRWFSALDHD